MTKLVQGVLVLEVERPQQCDACGTVAELRPYGPNGTCVCYPCAMLDPADAERQFCKRYGLDGQS